MKHAYWLTLACCCISRPIWAAPLAAVIGVESSTEASQCPDSLTLTRNVERILQRRLSGSVPADTLQVEVHFSATRESYSADVRSLGQKPGERRLTDRGRSCAALGEAVSVAIALLLDTELAQREAAANQRTAPPPAERPPPTPPASEPPPRDVAQAAALELRAVVEGGVATRLLGQSSVLLSEQLGVRLQHHLTLDAGFNAVLPSTTRFDVGAVRTTLLFASLRACYTFGRRFTVGPCTWFGLGRLRGVGLDYASVMSRSLLWTALGAGVVAEGPLWGRVFWGLSGAVWVPTRQSTFSVENSGVAWGSSSVGSTLSARLGFRIW